MSDLQEQRHTPGLTLAREFYQRAVRPLLTTFYPDLSYSAALIGPGSEVLGYDDETSTDHHWGPRVMLFVPSSTPISLRSAIHDTLAQRLPHRFDGYPTSFTPPDPSDNGTQLMDATATGPVHHRVEIDDLSTWLCSYLGIDLSSGDQIAEVDWLSLPQQKLLSIVRGEVFHDGILAAETDAVAHGGQDNQNAPLPGALSRLRTKLQWYPGDVWRYLLAATWTRICQEEHLVGRAGSTGDELGARVICARLVRDMMRLAFLYARKYAPYAKWFGRAFTALPAAVDLSPLLERALTATEWKTRDNALAHAYRVIGRIHNQSRMTPPIDPEPQRFFGRPFSVLGIKGHADALLATINASWLTEMIRRKPIGAIDTISDNTDLLEASSLRTKIAGLFGE